MYHFIVNLISGKGKALKAIRKLTAHCAAQGINYSVHVTKYHGHASELAKEVSTRFPTDTIIAVGGDGTFHEVVNGISDLSSTPIGFIPCGRGNDFARSAGFNKKPLKALNDILRGEEAFFDYLQVGDKRCLNVAGTGMDVDVLLRVDGSNKKLTYLKSLIACLRKFDPYPVEVTIDGKTERYDCLMAAACNGRAFGGNMRICPAAQIKDGLLDVVIITVPSGSVWRVLPKFLAGKHLDKYWTIHKKCEAVNISATLPIQLDGEIYPDVPLNCSVVKNGIRTFRVGK